MACHGYLSKALTVRSGAAEYLTYVAATGEDKSSIEMRYENENIWLTQKMMAELYGVSKQAISQHLQTIFADGELVEEAVVKKYLTTASDGKQYSTNHKGLSGEEKQQGVYFADDLAQIKDILKG